MYLFFFITSVTLKHKKVLFYRHFSKIYPNINLSFDFSEAGLKNLPKVTIHSRCIGLFLSISLISTSCADPRRSSSVSFLVAWQC